MAGDPIREALDAASEATRIAGTSPGCCYDGMACEMAPCLCSRIAASSAISAFLRALPGLPAHMGSIDLAAAVEKAAADG